MELTKQTALLVLLALHRGPQALQNVVEKVIK